MDQFTAQDDLGHLIKKHDPEAFHELYRTSFNKLQQYAMRYLYDWDDAEDLVQDAFLSLWSHPERYNETQPVFYYLSNTNIKIKSSKPCYSLLLKIQKSMRTSTND